MPFKGANKHVATLKRMGSTQARREIRKIVRAEPIAALYEQGKVSHVGEFSALEDELCSMTPAGFVGEGSPDRADALVWALSNLMLGATLSGFDVL